MRDLVGHALPFDIALSFDACLVFGARLVSRCMLRLSVHDWAFVACLLLWCVLRFCVQSVTIGARLVVWRMLVVFLCMPRVLVRPEFFVFWCMLGMF